MSGFRPATLWLLRHGRLAGFALLALVLLALPAAGLGVVRLPVAFTAIAVALGALLALAAWMHWQRERFIREAPLPKFLGRKLRERYPHLGVKDTDLIERGWRQFALACHRSRRAFVAMPSQAVDALWHEFILHTHGYRDWCALALGRFLHHTPAEVLGRDPRRNDGLRRAWYWACRDEAIPPRNPSRLPLLFALDAKLAIPGGYTYVPDCRGGARDAAGGPGTQCGTDFGNGAASGDGDGFGGAESDGGDGGDGGGDGGGCGGD